MKELLFSVKKKDFEIQTFQSGGPGGQHQNKTSSGVRIIHRASGAVGESRSDRSQHRNKRLALSRLAQSSKFKLWIQRRSFEISTGETMDQRIDKAMDSKNLRIETKDSGRWATQ